MSQLKSTVDRFWRLFETDQLAELGALIAPDCHFKMPDAELNGRDALMGVLRAYRVAFPDLHHETLHAVEAGDTIALELHVTGTHTGPMQTPHGTVPATGKRLVFESCDYIRVHEGRVVSWHVYHDPTPFRTALGLMG